jgi:hypothetical protein
MSTLPRLRTVGLSTPAASSRWGNFHEIMEFYLATGN